MFFREPAYSSTAKQLDNALHKVTDMVCLLVKSEDDAGINALVKYNFVSALKLLSRRCPFEAVTPSHPYDVSLLLLFLHIIISAFQSH